MTKEEATTLYESEFWQELSLEERAKFQLFEDRLCMPFDVFQEAVEKTLGRPVFTHEFADAERLRAELLGDARGYDMTPLAHLLTASVVLAQASYKGRDLAELRRDMAAQEQEPERVILWAEPNGWRATCYACGDPVPAGSGHVGTVRPKGKTVVACESCFDEQMRELHASGREF